MPVGLAPARLGSIGGRADFTEPIQGRETREANGGAKRLIGLAKPRFDASFFHQNVGQQRLPPASERRPIPGRSEEDGQQTANKDDGAIRPNPEPEPQGMRVSTEGLA